MKNFLMILIFFFTVAMPIHAETTNLVYNWNYYHSEIQGSNAIPNPAWYIIGETNDPQTNRTVFFAFYDEAKIGYPEPSLATLHSNTAAANLWMTNTIEPTAKVAFTNQLEQIEAYLRCFRDYFNDLGTNKPWTEKSIEDMQNDAKGHLP